MTNDQENRMNRDLDVQTCVGRADIALVLGAITEYPGLKALLDAKNERLRGLKLRQFSNLRTQNAELKLWRVRITPVNLQLSAALIALGTNLEDPSILDEAKLTEASLNKLSNPNFVEKTQKLFSLCGTHSAALANYQITPAFLENYETMVDNLKSAFAAMVEAKAEQKQITEEIETLLKEVDNVVLRIAILFETLKETQPVFYGIFQAAYHVPDAPGSPFSAIGYAIDAETGLGIARCRLRITSFQPLENPPDPSGEKGVPMKNPTPSYTDLMKSVKYTSPNAAFRYRNLPAGTYELTAYMAGYADVKLTFYVNTGKSTEVIIRLQKAATAAA